jgi:hypothetical protein
VVGDSVWKASQGQRTFRAWKYAQLSVSALGLPNRRYMMATIIFTPFIQHFVPCPPREVFGNTVGEVLDAYFDKHQRVRGFILNRHGHLRPRLALYVDGVLVTDRTGLSDPVHAHARVFIQQVPLDTEYESLN